MQLEQNFFLLPATALMLEALLGEPTFALVLWENGKSVVSSTASSSSNISIMGG